MMNIFYKNKYLKYKKKYFNLQQQNGGTKDRYTITPDGLLIINQEVVNILNNEFLNKTSIIKITIPNSVTLIGEDAFNGCTGLTSVIIPDSVTTISKFAFKGCTRLTSINIPDSVTFIGPGVFRECSGLTSVNISNSLTIISNYAFYKCTGLTSIDIPNGVTVISNYSFFGCTSLISVNIPDSVTTINTGAFRGCTGLRFVNIPNSITSIGNSAFHKTTSLNNRWTRDKHSFVKIDSINQTIIDKHHIIFEGSIFNSKQSNIIISMMFMFILEKFNSIITDVNKTSSGSFGKGILYTLINVETKKTFKVHGKINNNKYNSKITNFQKEFNLLGKFQHPNILHEIYIIYKNSEGLFYQSNSVDKIPLEYTELISEDLSLNFAIILTEALDDNLTNKENQHKPIREDIFKTIRDIFKFLLIIIFTVFYMYNKTQFVHSDLKEANITFKQIENEFYYKIIDFSDIISLELDDVTGTYDSIETAPPLYFKNNRHTAGTYNYQPNKIKNSTGKTLEIATDKIDMFALGKILSNIIDPLESNIINERIKDDPLYSNLVDLKNKLYNLDQKSRYSSRQALKYLLQLLPLFDINDRININLYLKNNFTILGNKFNIEDPVYTTPNNFLSVESNYEFTINQKLHDKLMKMIYNYETNVFDRCQFSIDKFRKNGYGQGISDAVLKYNICSYIGYDDRIPDGYIDIGTDNLNEFLGTEKKDLVALLSLKKKSRYREIIDIDYKILLPHIIKICFPVEREVYNKDKTQYENAIAIAEEIYNQYSGHTNNINVEKIINANPNKTAPHYVEFTQMFPKKLSVEIPQDKYFVCRHFGLLFKICCDYVNIPCKRIRGYYIEGYDYTDNPYPYNNHVWNVVKNDNNESVLIDIMHNYCGHKTCSGSGIFNKTYSINYYMPNIPLNFKSFVENKEKRKFVKDFGKNIRIL